MDGKLPTPQEKPGFNWSAMLWVLLLWIMVSYLFQLFSSGAGQRTLAYTRFKELVRQGRVSEITMKGNVIRGNMLPAKGTAAKQGDTGSAASKSGETVGVPWKGSPEEPLRFQTIRPAVSEPDLIAFLEDNGVEVTAETQERSWLYALAVTLLPWLLIIGVFVYMSRRFRERMGAHGGGPFGFAKSKAKRFTPTASTTTFGDVAGLNNAKQELMEIVAYLKTPARFKRLGAQLPKGLLLVGPPGVGKTLLAQAAAGEADVPFFSISGSEFIEMFVGVGASRVRDMFNKAKKEAPAMIFIDELDSIGRVRGSGVGGGHDEREQTLNQILAEMDGFAPHESVVVLAATNRPDVLDPALVRPGRFDRRITLNLPRKQAREKILNIHTRDKPMAEDVDLRNMAGRTAGFSGADLRNLVNEAALLAARQDKQQLASENFEQARDKILLGIERDEVISEEEKQVVAFHEAGHTLVAELMPDADPLQKVTIIPRGGTLGVTEQIPEKERYNMKKQYLLDRIAIMLGGRAAEKIQFDDFSTGAADDLKKATQLARRMVCQWGMSDQIGPVVFKKGEPHPFLGRELAEDRDYSEHTARIIDQEIKAITSGMQQRAAEVLEQHRSQLNALAEALLARETLNREEIDQVLDRFGTAN